MISMSLEGDARARRAVSQFVDDTGAEAHEWLLNMGYAISGNTQWLNQQATGGRLNVYPSVRKTPDGVRLQIKFRRANSGTRRLVVKGLSGARRHIWDTWTAQL